MPSLQAVYNWLVYFDDVRIEDIVKTWSVNISSNGSIGTANIELLYFQELAFDANDSKLSGLTSDMKNMLGVIDNMTNVKIFVQNVFSDKYQLVFDGNIKSKNVVKSPTGSSLSLQAVDYVNYMNKTIAPICMPVEMDTHPSDKFIWEAQGIDTSKVLTLQTRDMINFKGKSIKQILSLICTQALAANKIFSDRAGVSYWDGIWNRMDLMADIDKKILESEVSDYIIDPNASNVNTMYVLLNQILEKLLFEMYQDRDGVIRIKPPYWNQPILKSHIIDPVLLISTSENVNYQDYLTRVIITGGLDEDYQTNNDYAKYLWTPIGCYMSNGTWMNAKEVEGYEYGWAPAAVATTTTTDPGNGNDDTTTPGDQDFTELEDQVGHINDSNNSKIDYSYKGKCLRNSAKEGTISGNTVKLKAWFTAYFPANVWPEGGFKDRYSRWLDPDTPTVAIKPSVARKYNLKKDQKILITGTGKKGLDGRIYYFRDVGTTGKAGYDVTVDVLLHSQAEISNHWTNYSGYITFATGGASSISGIGDVEVRETDGVQIENMIESDTIYLSEIDEKSLNKAGYVYKKTNGEPIVGFGNPTSEVKSHQGVGAWFPSVEIGIKAHIQYLSSVYRHRLINDEAIVLPSFNEYGCMYKTVLSLGNLPNRNKNYGKKVLNLIKDLLDFNKEFIDFSDIELGTDDEAEYDSRVNPHFISMLKPIFVSRMQGKSYTISNNTNINAFFDMYINECKKQLIYPDVALAQMIIDTGWLCWGGYQNSLQNNFAKLCSDKYVYTNCEDWYWSK